MNTGDQKKYIKILLISWFLFLLLLTGVVIFFSYHLGEMQKTSTQHNHQIQQNTESIALNTEQIASLQKIINQLADQNKIPGPKGDRGERGDDGKDSLSTHTTTVKEVPVQGERGEALTFDALTTEQKAELKGNDGMQIELCRWKDRPELGWRYIGFSLCQPIRIVDL